MFVLSHNVARTKRNYINTNEILGELSQRFFSRAAGIFGVGRRPKADTSLALGRSRAGHYKDLTETGNRARKVSGTQGSISKTQFKHRTFHVLNLIPSIK